jgi:hypothetical protein
MSIGDAILFIGCLPGIMISLAAMLMFFNTAFYKTSERAAARLHQGSIVPFFVGLIPVLFIGVPGGFLLSIGSVAQFCGTLVFLTLFVLAFLGMGSVGRMIGYRITSMTERDMNPLMVDAAGILTLVLAINFPVIGWLVILPLSMVIGMGGVILGIINRFTAREKRMEPAYG